jgi:hypothetical protein
MRNAIREVNGRPVYWTDAKGVTHAAEGSWLTRDHFCLWTVCGCADVPANKGYNPGTGDKLTCERCIDQLTQ